MSNQVWQETFVPQPGALVANGLLFNTYTTAKTVLPGGCLYTFPPNFFYVGRMLRLTVTGVESHRVTGPDTMTFQAMLGSTVAFGSGPLNLTTTAHTTIPFVATCLLRCATVGAVTSATLIGQWQVQGQGFAITASVADNAGGSGYALGPNSLPVPGAGFDSTASLTFDFWVAQSLSTASNGLQVTSYLLESLN